MLKLKNNKKSYIYSILSFILTSFIFITVLFLLNIIGSNNKSIFTGDLFMQYISFIYDFLHCLKGEASFTYSFSNYIGSGNILTLAYYTLCPLNLLYLISPDSIDLITTIIITIKLSLASATFCYYASKNVISDNPFVILISAFYGLNGFAFCFYLNLMWLDAIYMLPIIIHLIIKLMKEGKYLSLIWAYLYLFVTNFYMGYICGIFTAIYFVMYLIYYYDFDFLNNMRKNIKTIIFTVIKYAFSVLLAVGLCSFIVFPTYGFLFSHTASDNFDFTSLDLNIFDIINSLFIGEMPSFDNRVPLIYCGIISLFFLIIFFWSKKILLKEKLFYGIILVFYLIAMLYLPLYKLLHAFDYPNFYGFRFSFVIPFVLLTIVCISLTQIDIYDFKAVKYIFVFLVLFYSFMATFQKIVFAGSCLNSSNRLLINAIYMLLWMLFAYIFLSKKHTVNKYTNCIFNIFLTILVISEIVLNSCLCLDCYEFSNLDDNEVNQWYYSEKEVIEKIKDSDKDFYRIFVNNEWNENAADMFNYNSLNTFSSADNYVLRDAMKHFGTSEANRLIFTHTLMPGFSNLFAVKYRVNIPNYDDWSYMNIDSGNYIPATYEENDKILPLAYMVKNDIYDYSFERNCFHNINNLCKYMTGEDVHIYTDLEIDGENNSLDLYNCNYDYIDGAYFFYPHSSVINGGNIVVYAKSDKDVYFEFYQDETYSYAFQPKVTGAENGMLAEYSVALGGAYKGIRDGKYSKVNLYTDQFNGLNFCISSLNIAEYNEDAFDKVYDELSQNVYQIDEFSGNHISGIISATEDKNVMFTSIPYDPEWYVYVDGELTKPISVVGDAFISVELEPGNHRVTFEYYETYSYLGSIITLVSIIVLCFTMILNVLLKKK